MDEMDKDIAQADSALEEPTDPIYQMLEDIIEISSTQPSEALMRAQTLLKLDEWLELDALCLARIQESRAFSYYEFKEWNLAIAAAELALTFEAQAEPYDSQARIELKQMCREYATAVLNSCKGRLRETQPTASAEPAEPVQPVLLAEAFVENPRLSSRRPRAPLTPTPSGVLEQEEQLPQQVEAIRIVEHFQPEGVAVPRPRTPERAIIGPYVPPTPSTRDDRF